MQRDSPLTEAVTQTDSPLTEAVPQTDSPPTETEAQLEIKSICRNINVEQFYYVKFIVPHCIPES